eukprot:TRINITY_DN13788_c0_g1_i1.p1 TRINITY_DN13788_c0_g1~~TRINITY_DN13788_c0_g1_i1.p1  ORF type:complete len:153 (-),score=6.35 TRINITY_DN13788_c0_g1_i1:162-620(-)
MFQTSSFGYQRTKKATLKYEVTGLGDATILNIGNIATFVSMGLCFYISCFIGSSGSYVLFLSPIFLLLNQNPGIFSEISDTRRYYPVVLFVAFYCYSTATWEIVVRGFLYDIFGFSAPGFASWKLIGNGCLLLCTIPNQVYLHDIFCWSQYW